MKHVFRITFVFCLVLLLTCCKKVNQGTQSNTNDTVDSVSILELRKDQLQEIYHRFPSPEEMLSVLDREQVEYYAKVVNPSRNYKKYLDSREQALNLGVYSADLAYLTIFGMHKESIGYFNAIYALCDNLQISSAFNKTLIDRFQNNITNSDSLEVIAGDAINILADYLVYNRMEEIFAIMSIGGFIEALYISFIVTGDFTENSIFVERIADQKFVLENLMNYCMNYSNDQSVIKALNFLLPVRDVYDSLQIEKEETQVMRQENGKLVIKGGEKILFTKDDYLNLKTTVFNVRKKITQN